MFRKNLAEQAARAAELRQHREDPNVVALQVERVRRLVDVLTWGSILAGLAYTMTNVQAFGARGHEKDTAGWWAAWGLEPAMSLLLLAMLLGEQVLGRWQVSTRATHDGLLNWIKFTKWVAFGATYTMNTWESWRAFLVLHEGAAGVVLHSVPPVLVLCAAEAGPRMRDRLAEAVKMAAAEAALAQGKTPARRAQPVAAPKTVRPSLAKTAGAATGRAARRTARALGGAVQWGRAALWLLVAQAGAASVGLAGPAVVAAGPGPVATGPAEQAGPGPVEEAGPERAEAGPAEQAGPGPVEEAGPERAEAGPAEQAGPGPVERVEAEQAGPGRAEAGPRLRVVPAETASERTAPFAPIDRPEAPQVDPHQDLPKQLVAAACAWAEEKHRAGVKLTRTFVLDGLRDDKVASVGHLMRTPLVNAVKAHIAALQGSTS